MKKYLLITILTLTEYNSFSQSTFGTLSYTAPEGWYAKQTADNTELLKKGMESTNCKIVFFKPVRIVTYTGVLYIKYRNKLADSAGFPITTPTHVQGQNGPGWASFSSLQNVGTKGDAYSIAFYSISDTKQTVFFAVYSTSDELCTNDLDAIIQSINLTALTTAQSDNKTKTKKISKRIRVLSLKALKTLVY